MGGRRVSRSLGLVAVLAGGCASPQLTPWVPPAPWASHEAKAPPAPGPAPGPTTPTQFASDGVRPARLDVPAGPPPAAPTVTPPPTPVATLPEPAARPAEPTEPSNYPNVRLRGRVEADAIAVNQGPKNKAIYGDFENAVGFRRTRLGAEGTAGDQVSWVSEFDLAAGQVAVKDVFVRVDRLPVLRAVQVGHQQEPFSLEGLTSTNVYPFAEFSPGIALDPSLNWGVAVYSYTDDKRVLVQAGAFRSGTDGTGTATGDENDAGFTGRLVFVPWYDDSDDRLRLLHLGGAVSQRFAKNDVVTFSQGPQSTLLQTGENPLTPFVPNITVPATQDRRYNMQAAAVFGPWSVQAEWTGTAIDQTGGRPVFLQGAYVLASYFLTGEHRRYDQEVGAFLAPRVRSLFACRDDAGDTRWGPGAWELTARLARLDFTDPDLPPAANGLRVGGRVTTLTVGVNWYLTDHARVMLNYVRAVPTNPNFGSSTADSFTVRTAVFW